MRIGRVARHDPVERLDAQAPAAGPRRSDPAAGGANLLPPRRRTRRELSKRATGTDCPGRLPHPWEERPRRGKQANGWVTVFDSVQHAVVAKLRFGTIYGKRNVLVRANVLVEFLRDADKAARRQVTQALSAVVR